MAFIVKKVSDYFWPVKYDEPDTDSGVHITQTFDAKFKRLPSSRYKELLGMKGACDEIFVAEILVGWRGIQNDDGSEIPFSKEKKAELIDRSGFARACSTAYIESVNGIKIKN